MFLIISNFLITKEYQNYCVNWGVDVATPVCFLSTYVLDPLDRLGSVTLTPIFLIIVDSSNISLQNSY